MAHTNTFFAKKAPTQKIDLKVAYAILMREYLHREQAKLQQPPIS